MSRMRTRPTSEQLPQALNRSSDLLTCLTATDERRFEIRGELRADRHLPRARTGGARGAPPTAPPIVEVGSARAAIRKTRLQLRRVGKIACVTSSRIARARFCP